MEQEETQSVKREEYYWAQIAAEIRRSWVKYKRKVKMKDFLIKFSFSKKTEKLTAEDEEFKLQSSKNFWLGAVLGRKKGKK